MGASRLRRYKARSLISIIDKVEYMNFVNNRKIWFVFSGALFIISVLALVFWGLKLGIDFTGGSLLEIKFKNGPEKSAVETVLKELGIDAQIQTSGQGTIILRTASLDQPQHQNIISKLGEKFGELSEERFDSIGPTLGRELGQKSITAIIVITIMILLYIAWSFRHVSKPVPSIVYGGIVVLTFIHDVTIPLGIFALLGHFRGTEIGSTFIPAVLTILGYSINDTIVVLDRVRENLRRMKGTFEDIVEVSIHQTISRSINTSLTTILALLAIYFFGGESIKTFALALMIGIFFGTYSSIFISAPLLVVYKKFKK